MKYSIQLHHLPSNTIFTSKVLEITPPQLDYFKNVLKNLNKIEELFFNTSDGVTKYFAPQIVKESVITIMEENSDS